MFVWNENQLTKYEITYKTTVQGLKEMVASKMGIRGEINLVYQGNILDGDLVLMKDECLRQSTYPLLVLSQEGETNRVSIMVCL